MKGYNQDVRYKQDNRQQYLPLILLIIALGLGLFGFILFFLNRNISVAASWAAAGGPRNSFSDLLNSLQLALVSPGVACGFGYLIVRRQPRHPIGWLLIMIGAIMAVSVVLAEWAVRGYFLTSEWGIGAQIAAWVTNWVWIVMISLVLIIIALFPSGKFLSDRWRLLFGACALVFFIPGLIAGAIETPMTSAFQIPNPFIRTHHPELYKVLFFMTVVFMLVTTIVVLLETLVRYRHGLGIEQQQIKWLLTGVALFALMVIVGILLFFDLLAFQTNASASQNAFRLAIGSFITNAAPLAVLVGIGIAIVRHQLYDIDFLIRRTTSYAILTGFLAFIYFFSVILLQQLLSPLTGESTPAVVLSTLLIAALFLPVRRRVQNIIDKRFFRQKYDAQKTLEQFATTIRDETDLDALTNELLRVIQVTMEPEHASVWLKPTAGDRSPNVEQKR